MVDLIYADENLKDLGVLQEYAFDCAFGKDENSFEIVMPRRNEVVLKEGYFVYVENSEIGGIIDSIGVDTINNRLIYNGRTWQGILAEKVLIPSAGEDYMLLSGEANSVLADIITACDLEDLFEASDEDSGFEIDNALARYDNPMHFINETLWAVTAKLDMVYDGVKQKVILSAIPYIDYSLDEEWSADNKSFEATKNYLPTNHLICLGNGSLADRYVIHLFTDEAGNIQPYTTVESPVSDEDYILDTSQQDPDLTGARERVEILSNEGSQETKNYVLTDSEPADYKTNLGKYYHHEFDEETQQDKYNEIETIKVERYQKLKVKPTDWETNFNDYYTRSGDNYNQARQAVYELVDTKPDYWDSVYTSYFILEAGEYKHATAVTTTKKVAVSAKKAKKSFKNGQYKNLFTRHWDGTQWIYDSVSDVNKDRYKVQSKKPSDWTNNYNNYYQKKKKAKGYETVKGIKHKRNGHTVTVAPTWKKKKYYTKYTDSKPPVYDKSKTYFQETSTSKSPTWASNTYYEETPNYTMPTFVANNFYVKVIVETVPAWDEEDVYELKIDNYAELVKSGIERLQEARNCDTLEISLRQDIDYDIGDVVGVVDEVTGLAVWQPITKKIIKISRHKKTVEYEIGGQTYGDGSSYR